MYVAVKGGETAILNSHGLVAEQRRGDPGVPEISLAQIREQLRLAVARVMTEGSVYDPDLAALALKQSAGDAVEAITGMVAAGRLVEPDEIARLVMFCAENPALNGAVLHANLGQIER